MALLKAEASITCTNRNPSPPLPHHPQTSAAEQKVPGSRCLACARLLLQKPYSCRTVQGKLVPGSITITVLTALKMFILGLFNIDLNVF